METLTFHQPGWSFWNWGRIQGSAVPCGPHRGRQVIFPAPDPAAAHPAHRTWTSRRTGSSSSPVPSSSRRSFQERLSLSGRHRDTITHDRRVIIEYTAKFKKKKDEGTMVHAWSVTINSLRTCNVFVIYNCIIRAFTVTMILVITLASSSQTLQMTYTLIMEKCEYLGKAAWLEH